MLTYKMHRYGEFRVFRTPGTPHCGIAPTNYSAPLLIKYDFRATCAEGSLDKKGFLFDQIRIDQFFQALTRVAVSCEVFTHACARLLFKQIRAENGGCTIKSMSLTLSPAPSPNSGADITVEWEAD